MEATRSQTEIHRKYCNHIKKSLLRDALHHKDALHKDSLLDLACGRGGDLLKWNELRIPKVFALDVDLPSIQEAIRRYIASKKFMRTNVRFFHANAFSGKYIKHNILRGSKVNIVSCMFALHYFCESPKSLSIFLSNVSEFLEDGGIFIGVAPDSYYITKMLLGTMSNDFVSISHGPTPESYHFAIHDPSNTDYFAFRGTSTEYLINKTLLLTIAKSHNLIPTSPSKPFPNIYDDYPNHPLKMSPISQLYMSFSFTKSPP